MPAKSDPAKSQPKSLQRIIGLKKSNPKEEKHLITHSGLALFMNDGRRWVDDASLC